MTEDEALTIDVDGNRIAVRRRAGSAPGIVWLGGFNSEMTGTKAAMLDQWAADSGHAFLRHDYSGHGQSGGAFRDGTISRWMQESLAVFRAFSQGPQVLVASSMGAWIALRMIAALRAAGEERVAGLVLIAPAPDFTSELLEPQLGAKQRKALETQGYFEEASDYSPHPTVYTRALIEDGHASRVMTGPIDTHCPIHIMHGLRDPDVPHRHALKLVSHLPSDDVTFSMVADGDHRLSRPQDLDQLRGIVERMVAQVGA
ncbi:MAG: alpha/beta hydrolase [Rhizobiaceae bacterium]